MSFPVVSLGLMTLKVRTTGLLSDYQLFFLFNFVDFSICGLFPYELNIEIGSFLPKYNFDFLVQLYYRVFFCESFCFFLLNF